MTKLAKWLLACLMLGGSLCAQGAPTAVNILAGLVRCPTITPAILMWTGTGFTCATLGQGLVLQNGTLVLNIPQTASTPTWQAETVALTSLATGATSTPYTPLKTPVTGVVLWWYNSTNIFMAASGAMVYTGAPLTFTLPTGWTSTDTIVISYQSQ
jgi:hypothetical protein